MTPKSRPNITREKALQYMAAQESLSGKRVIADGGVILLGIRGYYLDTMGAPAKNDRGQYDDALVLLTRDAIATFNANTDPSRFRAGIATLRPGIWRYKPGIHGLSKPKAQQYAAFVQAGPVVVIRDGTESVKRGTSDNRGKCLGGGHWEGWFGINIHRGGKINTSSLGCQTTPPSQWEEFHGAVTKALKVGGQRDFDYVLIDEAEFRKRR